MIVVHVVLSDDGSWSIDGRDFALAESWEKRTGGKLFPVAVGEKKESRRKVVADNEVGENVETLDMLPEQARAVVKKDMSAGKERGAPVRARAEALCLDLGIPKNKANVAAIGDAMEALIADYEQMIIDLNSSADTAKDKGAAWDRLVSMILTKGR